MKLQNTIGSRPGQAHKPENLQILILSLSILEKIMDVFWGFDQPTIGDLLVSETTKGVTAIW